jgi:hypothetical protein
VAPPPPAYICPGDSSVADVFTFTTPTFGYTVSSQASGSVLSGENPTLQLVAGVEYTFVVDAASYHPLYFGIDQTGCNGGYTPGNMYNSFGPIASGTVTLSFPTSGATLTYVCAVHCFFGTIEVVDANSTQCPGSGSGDGGNSGGASSDVVTTAGKRNSFCSSVKSFSVSFFSFFFLFFSSLVPCYE